MPVYLDQKTKTYYCKFYYEDWKGQKRQKLKRGFKLQREAKDFEREFLEQYAKNPDISFNELYRRYKEHITRRLRKHTTSNTFASIENHMLPFFGDMLLSDITPATVAAWQNEMLDKDLASTTLKFYNTRLKTIFNYAVEYCGLVKNPCGRSIGNAKPRKMKIWTPKQYKLFADAIAGDKCAICFDVLYYTGMRVGEVLALTLADIDLEHLTISVNKTYFRYGKKDYTNDPKTAAGLRTIDIPDFLADEIKQHIKHLYKPDPDTRIFPFQDGTIRYKLRSATEKAGLPAIRVHDLRHSHVSLLIELGANPVLIAKRLGHDSAYVTLKTYAHLFPDTQLAIVRKIKK